MRKNILSIGRDSTIATIDSQLYRRVQTYDKYHTFTFLVLNVGEPEEIMIGSSRVFLVGGSNIVSAFFRTVYFAYKESKKNKYDLVTTQDVLYAGLVGLLVSKLFSMPLYVQLHGDYLDNPMWFKSKVGKFNKLMNLVGRQVLLRADRVRVVSERLRGQLIKKYNLDPEIVLSIPIGTDTTKFVSQESSKRSPVILFAQRLIPEKCPILFVQVTIEVMKRNPDVTVKIAGDGFLLEEMQSLYKKNNLLNRVDFLGMVEQSDLISLYSSSSCYLHTADWEGWGMPMIEAMASGCPVVTTDTGCAGEAIKHNETGLVTLIDDSDTLVEEVDRLLSDSDLWHSLSKQGIIEAKYWSFENLARKNMEWYGSVKK